MTNVPLLILILILISVLIPERLGRLRSRLRLRLGLRLRRGSRVLKLSQLASCSSLSLRERAGVRGNRTSGQVRLPIYRNLAFGVLAALGALALWFQSSLYAADGHEEQRLIGVLQSDRSAEE